MFDRWAFDNSRVLENRDRRLGLIQANNVMITEYKINLWFADHSVRYFDSVLK